MRVRKYKRVAGAALAAAAAMSVAAWWMPAAEAVNAPACGSTVTGDVTLTSDLLGCPGDGLVVDADDVRVDLGGHRIAGVSGDQGAGIVVDGHSGVTIINGSIAGFTAGVLLVDGSHDRLRNLDIRGSSDKAVILFGARRNVLSHNRLHDTAVGGVGLFNGADHNRLRHNRLSRTGSEGVENLFSDHNTVTHNRISQTGSAVILESSDNLRITRNEILHGVASACDGCGIAIQVYGNRNVVAHNKIVDSPRYGIEVDDFQDPGHSPVADNRLLRNRITNAGVGIAIGPEAGGIVLNTVLAHNRVRHSQGDGIQLIGPSTGLASSLLTANLSVFNGNYGIETVPGTRDGGHNRAFGNGAATQCLNVTCGT